MKELSLEQRLMLNAKMDFALQINCKEALRYAEKYVREYHKAGYDVVEEEKKIVIFEQIIKNLTPLCKY